MSDNGSIIKKGVCELMGTAALTFLACGVGVGTGDTATTCIAFGAVIVAMAYSVGNISGGHFNPAVSLNFLIRGKLKVVEFFIYIAFQFVGGFIGSCLLGLLMRAEFLNLCANMIQKKLKHWDNEKLKEENDAASYICALFIEILITFYFVTAINGATDEKHGNQKMAGFIIGFALTLGVAVGYGFTGGSLNPARSFGPAIAQLFESDNNQAAKEYWVFLVGPLAGGALGGLFYKLVF